MVLGVLGVLGCNNTNRGKISKLRILGAKLTQAIGLCLFFSILGYFDAKLAYFDAKR
jgi:hypothetical protein